MRKLLLTVFGIASILVLSSLKNENIQNDISAKKDKYLKRTDTLNIIEKECALFLRYNSQDISDMRKRHKSEDDFYAAADDMNYYYSAAGEYLKDTNMKIISVDTIYSVINFQNKHFINITDTTIVKDITSSLILYKEGKKPTVIAPIEISNEYNKYFMK